MLVLLCSLNLLGHNGLQWDIQHDSYFGVIYYIITIIYPVEALDIFRYRDIIAWEYDFNLMNVVYHENIKYPG